MRRLRSLVRIAAKCFPIQVDTSQAEQMLIEDCTVCCRPITLTIRSEPGVVSISTVAAVCDRRSRETETLLTAANMICGS